MYEACFRVSLKHASLWAEIFKKVRLKGSLSYLHMYFSYMPDSCQPYSAVDFNHTDCKKKVLLLGSQAHLVVKCMTSGILITRACSLAAMGKKYPAHQRDPRPGYVNATRLFMMALQPAQSYYVKTVLIPACPGLVRWPDPLGWNWRSQSRCMLSVTVQDHMERWCLHLSWRGLPFPRHKGAQK